MMIQIVGDHGAGVSRFYAQIENALVLNTLEPVNPAVYTFEDCPYYCTTVSDVATLAAAVKDFEACEHSVLVVDSLPRLIALLGEQKIKEFLLNISWVGGIFIAISESAVAVKHFDMILRMQRVSSDISKAFVAKSDTTYVQELSTIEPFTWAILSDRLRLNR